MKEDALTIGYYAVVAIVATAGAVFVLWAVVASAWKLLNPRTVRVKWSGPYAVAKGQHRRHHRHGDPRPSKLVESVDYSDLKSSWSEEPRPSRRRKFDPVTYRTFGVHEGLVLVLIGAIVICMTAAATFL